MATELKRKSVVERYFEKRFVVDVKGKPCEDQCVLLHSNKVCVIAVAPGHPLLNSETIKQVSYQVSKKLNRLDNKVRGKGKKGAQLLDSQSPLCQVTCCSGKTYTLCSCVKGKLIEVNEALLQHPELLLEKPETEGYVAIVLPKLTEVDNIRKETISNEEYQDILKDRDQNKCEFVLQLSKTRFYIGGFTTVACLLVLVVWPLLTSPGQHLMFPVLVAAVGALMAWENRGRRTCVLNCDTKQYVCAKDGEPVFTGNFHNVYIRLKAQKHGAGQMFYYVVLNGYRMREQKITSYSKNDRKLRILAKRLAEKLDLNFFDMKANSKDHVIRHRPGHDTTLLDDGPVDSHCAV